VILNFGSSSDANMLTLWNPANMKIGGAGDAATGINLADGQSHRVTLTWTSASGELKVFDNGQLVRTATGYHQGGTLPADGFMVLGQKMNHPGNAADPGWNANEHYEGSIFNAAIASKALSPTEVASAPLASVLDKQSGLLVDVRSIGGPLTDTTGTHSLVRDGGLTFSTGQVDLAFAPAPPGALLHLHATLGAPGDATDHVVSAMLGGLPHGTVVSDGTHSATVGASTPEVDVHAWALGSLTAQLPVGFHSNARISLEVITQGPDGAQAHMATSQPLVMDPLHPIPDATFSGADQAITDENSAVSGVLTVTDPTAADAHVLAGTEHGNLGSLDIAADGHWAYTPDGRAGALHAGDVGHENFAVHSADGSLHHIAVDVTGADQPPPPPMPAPAADDTVPAAEAITLQADHAGPAHALPGDPAPSLDHSGADQSGGVDPYLLAVGVQATVPESVHATLDGALAGGVDPSQLPVPDLDPALLGAATGEGGLDHVFADPPPVAADHAMPIEAAALPVPDTEPQHH
jgi:VCBS repeat-containing protein